MSSPNGYSFGNIGKSRYLYAPSVIGLKQGEGSFSQKLLFSAVAVAVGATDNVTLLAGTFTLFPPILSIVGGKVSGQVAPNVHLAAGGEVFIIGISNVEARFSVDFGMITMPYGPGSELLGGPSFSPRPSESHQPLQSRSLRSTPRARPETRAHSRPSP